MIERTLVLVKPDGVQRALVGEIVSRLERPGFKIIGLKMLHPTKETAGCHYADDEAWLKSVGQKTKESYEKKGVKVGEDALAIGRRVRQMLIDFISLSPVVAICLEGHGVVDKVRTIVGSTAPSSAAPGTIRGDLALDSYGLADKSGRAVQNLIHASDSPESAEREIAVWFRKDELHPYQRIDELVIYRTGKDIAKE
jgi:nucleoside-diphosphate kinase